LKLDKSVDVKTRLDQPKGKCIVDVIAVFYP